jgi:glutamate-1-semialdehyde 2,1-aminomutase
MRKAGLGEAQLGRLTTLRQEQDAIFVQRTPRSRTLLERGRQSMPCGVPMAWMAGLYRHHPMFVARGQGATFVDVDGNAYLDMNQADLSATLGFAPAPVTEAISRRAAAGSSFLLPTEDSIVACELLARRTGLPGWQFSGSASTANNEIVRLARLVTGRDKVLMFEGKYHGHVDELLVGMKEGMMKPELLGIPGRLAEHAVTVPFNDLDALEEALAGNEIACVLAEPALTNCGLVFPDTGFWASARDMISACGALLVMDEAHTFSFAYGGLTRRWKLQPDAMVLGKGLGTGMPFGLYGLSRDLVQQVEDHLDVDIGPTGLALGGTTFGSALAVAVARAALEHCLTEDDYARVETLGLQLSGGLEKLFRRHRLNWRAPVAGGRSGWVLAPDLPRNAAESAASLDPRFVDTRRVFMANRGVWEAITSAGPACSFAHQSTDVERYLEVAEEFLAAVLG